MIKGFSITNVKLFKALDLLSDFEQGSLLS